MLRVELYVCKLNVDIDHDLKFCLKVKLEQRHEDRETRSLIISQILHGLRAVSESPTGTEKPQCSLPS